MHSFTTPLHDGTLFRRLDEIEAKIVLLESKLDLLCRVLDGMDGFIYTPSDEQMN